MAHKRVAILSPIAWRTPPRQYGAWETVAGNIARRTLVIGWRGSPLRGEELSGAAESATLPVVGGALDAFTYLGPFHVFANAMTGHVVLLGLNAVQGDWRRSLHPLLPILSFFLGTCTAKAINLRLVFARIESSELSVLNLEIATFAIL